jgi:phage/plasmid-like protein (TIGR03299 family)
MAGVTRGDVDRAQQAFDDYQLNRGDKAEYAGSRRDPGFTSSDAFMYDAQRGTPWHGTGTAADGPMKLGDALQAIPWETELWKLAPINEKGYRTKAIEDKRAVVRTDNQEPLGVVGKNFKMYQPADMLGFAEAVADVGGRWDTIGSLKGGRFVFAAMALDGLDLSIAGELFEGYLLVSQGMVGNRALGIDAVMLRSVCKNSVNVNLNGLQSLGIPPAKASFRLRHTSGLEGRIQQARQALQLGFGYASTLKALGEKLLTVELVEDQVREIFENAFPIGDDKSDKQRENSVAFKMLRDWQESDNLEPIRETAWGALQAGFEFIDYGRESRARNEFGAADTRAYSLLYGDGGVMKSRLIRAVVEAAA